MISLRPYQAEGIAMARHLIMSGQKRILLVLPTGGGKTIVAAAVISGAIAKGKRALFLAHRREIVSQSYWKLIDAGIPEQQCGVIMADGIITRQVESLVQGTMATIPYRAYRPGAPAQVASVQTLSCRSLPPADVVFIDEAHHVGASSWSTIASHYLKSGASIIGLTATPLRSDKKSLKDHFDVLHQIASFADLAEKGHLCLPRVFGAKINPDLDGIKITGGDYDGSQLEERVNKRVIVDGILEHWGLRSDGRSTVIFAPGVAGSKNLVDAFRGAGVSAEHIDATTPKDARDAILYRLKTGKTQVVSNMAVLTEGWDEPRVKCVVLDRPTQSLGLALQMMGRGLRPWNNTEAIILDHALIVMRDNEIYHGFPQDNREWSLDDEKRKKKSKSDKESKIPVKTCPKCYAICSPATRLCGCGYEWISNGPSIVSGEFMELIQPEKESVEARKRWYSETLSKARKLGFKLGWARHAYMEKYGKWPSFWQIENAWFPKEEQSHD